MSEQTAEVEAPAPADASPIDAAIALRRKEWAAESSKPNGKPSASQEQPSSSVKAADTAETAGNAPVSDDGATAKNTAGKPALDAGGTSDLSWLPEKFHSPQSRQGKEFLDWTKAHFHRESKFTKEMQALAKDRETYKADLDLGQTIRTKRPDIADVAYRMGKGESLRDIVASMKDDPGSTPEFEYSEHASPEIDKRVETVAEATYRKLRDAERTEASMSEKQREEIQNILIGYSKDNAIDGDVAFAAIQSAGAALAEDGLVWTAENAERVLKRHLALVKAQRASGSNGNGKGGESGLSKVASPTGIGVGATSIPPPLSTETRKRWAKGEVTDEERMRIFNRIPTSRRGQDDGAAGE